MTGHGYGGDMAVRHLDPSTGRRILRALLRCVVFIAGTGLGYVLLVARPVPVLADDGSGVLGPLNPDDPHGVPLDHYEITADTGDTFDFPRKLLLFFTSALFALCRWVIGLAVWLIDWVLDFKITDYLTAPVARLVSILETQLVTGLGLAGFCLILAAVMCGIWVLRGQRSRGVTEFVVTLVIAAVAATYLSAPASMIFGKHDGILAKTRDASLELAGLLVTNGKQETGGGGKVTKEINRRFTDAFVRYPHQAINYGIVFDADPKRPHKCLKVYNELVARAPGTTDPTTWDRMGQCDKKLGAFNKNPTWDRLGAALPSVVAAVFIAVLAVFIVLALLVAQLWLVFEVVRLIFALVVGLVPGPGRTFLYKTIGGILAALAAVVATIGFLAVFVVLIRGLLTAARNESLFVRFLILDITLFCGLAWYKHVVDRSRAAVAGSMTRLGYAVGQPAAAIAAPAPPRARTTLHNSADQFATAARPVGATLNQLRPRTIQEHRATFKEQTKRLKQSIDKHPLAKFARRTLGKRRPEADMSSSDTSSSNTSSRPPAGSPGQRLRPKRRVEARTRSVDKGLPRTEREPATPRAASRIDTRSRTSSRSRKHRTSTAPAIPAGASRAGPGSAALRKRTVQQRLDRFTARRHQSRGDRP